MKYIIPILAILLFFSSCADNSKSELAVFRGVTESLQQSNQMIVQINKGMNENLYQNLSDPRTENQARIWQPIALKITELALSVRKYIKDLKIALKDEAGYNEGDKSEIKDYTSIVNKIFIHQNKGEDLYKRLTGLIDSLSRIDENMSREADNLTNKTYYYLDSGKIGQKGFTEKFFKNISVPAALSILEKFENDILNMEKELISYCYYHTKSFSCGMDYFHPLISVSSVCVKAGDNIEITAGVGSFSRNSAPKFTIDDHLASMNESGVVVYKFKTPSKAGNYTKSVKLEYTKPDGTLESMTKNIEYTVVEPNQNQQ